MTTTLLDPMETLTEPEPVASAPRVSQKTTPGRLRQLSIVLTVGIVLFGVFSASATQVRRKAADDIVTDASPLLVSAEELYVSLADADAAATESYLAGGSQTNEVLARYDDDVKSASDRLAQIGSHAQSTPEMQSAVRDLSNDLPRYTSLVATARENNRQGNPVGTAYLRSASALMRETMLPRATQIYGSASDGLRQQYATGTSWGHGVGIAAVGIVLVAGLVAAQIFVTRRSKRWVNPPLAIATVLVVLVLGWTALQFARAQHSLATAERDGSSPVQVLAASRILALRAEAASTLSVVDRDPADVAALTDPLGGSTGREGALGDVFAVAPESAGHSSQIVAAYNELVDTITHVHDSLATDYDGAVGLTLDEQASRSKTFDELLLSDVQAALERFDGASGDAGAGFSALLIGLLAICVAAEVLVLVGLQLRIREYR